MGIVRTDSYNGAKSLMYKYMFGFLLGWWASIAYSEGQAAVIETVEKGREQALSLRRRFPTMEIPEEVRDVF